MIEKLEQYVRETQAQLGDAPTAVVASWNGEIVYEAYYPGAYEGIIDVDERALWPLYSATKTYVATLVLQLCEEGAMGLDAPVIEYLPAFGTKSGKGLDRDGATVRHLMCHTSGIDLPKPDSDDVPADLEGGWIETEPGTVFNYSWQGMHVLQRAIEAATGEVFPDVLYDRVLDPLGLTQTRYLYDHDPDLLMLPTALTTSESDEPVYARAHRFLHPHFGLYTTAREFARFGMFWYTEYKACFSEALKAEMLKQHTTRPSDNGKYGLMVWLFEEAEGFVVSGAGSKVMGVAPDGGVVAVLRLPQEGGDRKGYDFYRDKVEVLKQAGRLGN